MFIETNKGLRNVSYLKEVASYGGLFWGDLPALLKFVYPDGTVEKVFSVKDYNIVEYALRNGGWVIV